MRDSTGELVEHFFRHESANLIAVLTRAFGMRRINLIEDVVQTSMLEAMNAWKYGRVPENPAGWMHRAAKSRMFDAIRREKVHANSLDQASRQQDVDDAQIDQWFDDENLPDSLLRMIFVCCHPMLERKSQIALTLKTLCGFGISEISRGLLLPKETVKKRLQRARRTLAENPPSLDLPSDNELQPRLSVVHDVLYLMFNEGYSASSGFDPIREEFCEEAARLTHLICESELATPETLALLALMLLHSARFGARVDDAGTAILLEDQDRTDWDRDLICFGQYWLSRSRTDQPSRYHFEAAIVLEHCVAPSVRETNWKTIAQLYERLLHQYDSPIYKLNHAIAIAQTGRTEQALTQLQALHVSHDLREYALLDCAIAQIHERSENYSLATDCYLQALSKATAEHEKAIITQKLRDLDPRAD